jgi:D-beta-D-heptose 7-phosphate kinase/D-beta-D-heptose 1-phosphate adenosyltransferase
MRAAEEAERWRRRGWRVGFTDGQFDLLHPGHIHLLEQARRWCDRLIVGVHADAAVRRLGGSTGPMQAEAARAAVLASQPTVDLVTFFEEDTPLELIEAIRPDVLIKGADHRIEEVVGGVMVQEWGGVVRLAELLPDAATTVVDLQG